MTRAGIDEYSALMTRRHRGIDDDARSLKCLKLTNIANLVGREAFKCILSHLKSFKCI